MCTFHFVTHNINKIFWTDGSRFNKINDMTASSRTCLSEKYNDDEHNLVLPPWCMLRHQQFLPIVASEPSVQMSTQWKDKSHLVLSWKQFSLRGLLKMVLGHPKGLKTILCKWQLQITYRRLVSVNWFLSLPAWGKKYQSSVKSSIM